MTTRAIRLISSFAIPRLLAAGILAACGGSVWALSNPSTCTKTGAFMWLTELRDLDHDGVGETPVVGSTVDGETIYYQATLYVWTAGGQCAYEGGSLCIDPPGPNGCTDVTPAAGIPLLCDNDGSCNPDGVPAVDSLQLAYVVNSNDFDTSGLCASQVRAMARYHNGTTYFHNGVSGVYVDLPICDSISAHCGDGIVDAGEECDDGDMSNTNECSNNCTGGCGNGIVNTGEECDDGNQTNGDGCDRDCMFGEPCGDFILTVPGETCDPPGSVPDPASGDNQCRRNCTYCGDDRLDAGEGCDDGNQASGDGCTSSCIREPAAIYVDCSRLVGGDGSPGNPRNSLRDAIDVAPPASEIHLLGGACPVEYLQLSRGVSFMGDPTLPRALIAVAPPGPSTSNTIEVRTGEPVLFKHVTLDPNMTIGVNLSAGDPSPDVTLIDVERATVHANHPYRATIRDSVDVSLVGHIPGGGLTVDIADSQGLVFATSSSGGTTQLTARRSSISGFSLRDHNDFTVDIEDCLFEASGFDVQMERYYGALRVFVTGTTFRNMPVSILYNSGIFEGGSTAPIDIRLEGNRFENSPVEIRIMQAGPNFATNYRQVTMQNNLFINSGVNLNLERSRASGEPPVGIHLANNTIVGAPTGISITADRDFGSTPQQSSVDIINNIVLGGGTGMTISSPAAAGDILDVRVNHNDLFGNTAADYVFNVPGQVSFDGNIAEDPLFADPDAGDFRLTHASPCIDAGQVGSQVPVIDHDGVSRPVDGNGDGLALPDIGAFEFRSVDADGDGFTVGADCDDNNPGVHPGAPDLPGNAADEDCSGAAVCAPGASWRNHGDFVHCVTHECNQLVGAHQVSRMQCSALIKQAIQSNVGKEPRRR